MMKLKVLRAPPWSSHQGHLTPSPTTSTFCHISTVHTFSEAHLCPQRSDFLCARAACRGWVLESPFWIINLWRHLQRGNNSFQKNCSLCHANQRPGMEMRFLKAWGIFRATCWLGRLAELLPSRSVGSGPGLWGWAAGKPRVGFLGQGMSCCLQSVLATSSSWASWGLMPGKVFSELSSCALLLLRKF